MISQHFTHALCLGHSECYQCWLIDCRSRVKSVVALIIGNSRTGGRIQLAIYRAVIVTKFLSHN